MAYHRVGKHEQARKLLAESLAWTRSEQNKDQEDWTRVLILQREARLSLLDFEMQPAGGTFHEPQKVRIEVNDKAAIYYTLDGSTPTEKSPRYTAPIEVAKSATLKVLVLLPGGESGVVVEARLVIARRPTASRSRLTDVLCCRWAFP